MEEDNRSTIAAMVRAKTLLKNRESNPNPELIIIVSLIDEYISKDCVHNIVYDMIDITPDTSKTIRYCTECYTDFPHPS